MEIIAIIQARMNSSRLPKKVLADICGVPMLLRVVERVKKARYVKQLVVATSLNSDDDDIQNLCNAFGIACFRGDLHDVLDRYYSAAMHYGADVVVRVTADCPLIDPLVIDHVIKVFLSDFSDYTSNTIQCTYPDGLDTEVFCIGSLERAWREARLSSEREHVTPYIYKHPELFKLKNVEHTIDLSTLRWTVDEARDLDFVRAVYKRMNASEFTLNDVLKLVERHPEMATMNHGIMRNEGYLKSLQQDALAMFTKNELS